MTTDDFFRARLDAMIGLKHPLAVPATRLPWEVIEAAVAPKLARQVLQAKRLRGDDLLGAHDSEFGGRVRPAGRPRLPIRLMASLLYLKNSFVCADPNLRRLRFGSAPRALADLRRIQRDTVSIDSGAPMYGVSTVQPLQADALAALRIKKPTLDTQLSLL